MNHAALTGGVFPHVLYQMTMETQYVLIDKREVEQQIRQLQRAIRYCMDAKPSSCVSLDAEPTETYPGASGYALATMKDAVQSLESNVLLSSLYTR